MALNTHELPKFSFDIGVLDVASSTDFHSAGIFKPLYLLDSELELLKFYKPAWQALESLLLASLCLPFLFTFRLNLGDLGSQA